MAPRPAPPASPEPTTRFPIPLVGLTVILLMLIVLTPVLITGGGGAGALLAQADIVVDHPPHSFNTTFSVWSVGAVRYAEINIGLNQDYVKGTPASQVGWTWFNVTEQVTSFVVSAQSSIAVNVSVYYISPSGAAAWYYGILAAYYDVPHATLTLAALSSGIAVPGGALSTMGSSVFPLHIPLAYQGSSVVPP